MPYVCRNYNEAHATFNLRPAVRSKAWQPNERPLDPRPVSHHRLIQGETSYGKHYDLKLYKTIMARFYEPKVEDGQIVERKLYMGHESQTSRRFFWEATRFSVGVNTCSDQTIMPVYSKHFMQDEDDVMFSLDAYFVQGVLNTTRSRHTPHYRMVADNDVRQFKQRVAARFEPYIMLAQMRMPEFKAECQIKYDLGRKFGGEGFNRAYYMSIQEMWDNPEPEQQDVDVFFEMCQAAYNTIASKRGMEQPDFQVSGRWWSRQQNASASTVDDLDKGIEPAEFRRAILDRIHKYVGSNSMKKAEEVKQFPKNSEYPRSNIHT